jgi:hypothetical protein
MAANINSLFNILKRQQNAKPVMQQPMPANAMQVPEPVSPIKIDPYKAKDFVRSFKGVK